MKQRVLYAFQLLCCLWIGAAATSLRSQQGPRTQDVLEAAAEAQERGVAASMARSVTSGLRAGLAKQKSTKLADTVAQSASGLAGVA
eukprot:3099031-Amphidinium_carterae.1